MAVFAGDQDGGIAREISWGGDLLNLQFDFHRMLPKQIRESPMAWIIKVNGFVLDARHLRRVFRKKRSGSD
jgi:hypothetical protein